MADAHAAGITQPFVVIFSVAAAGCAGYVVFGGIGEYGKLFFDPIPHG